MKEKSLTISLGDGDHIDTCSFEAQVFIFLTVLPPVVAAAGAAVTNVVRLYLASREVQTYC